MDPQNAGLWAGIAGAVATAIARAFFVYWENRKHEKKKIKIAADTGDKRRRLLGIVQERRASRDI